MNKFIITLISILIISASAQQCENEFKEAVPDIQKLVADVQSENFIAAIQDASALYSLVQTLESDCAQCFTDAETLLPDVEKIAKDVGSKAWASALTDIVDFGGEIYAIYNDCGLGNLEYQSSQCQNDISSAIADIEDIISDVENKNFTQALTDAMALYTVVQVLESDCSECITDVEEIIPDLEAIVQYLSQREWELAAEALVALEESLRGAYNTCGEGFEKVTLGAGSCEDDFESAISGVEQLIADVKAKNFIACIQDAAALYGIIESIEADCDECETDFSGLLRSLEAIIGDISKGNWSAAEQALISVIGEISAIREDCFGPAFI